MIIIASQIAQISQYMFLNDHRFQRFLNYTSSTKDYTSKDSSFKKKLAAWWHVGRDFSMAWRWLGGDEVVCEGRAAW